MSIPPGVIRDSILRYLATLTSEASVEDIHKAVRRQLGPVPPSSVRSYLNGNTPDIFERPKRGLYRLRETAQPYVAEDLTPTVVYDKAQLYRADCFDWLTSRAPNSIHAVVTDPPYGLTEYTEKEQTKLRNGKGGVWRIPPSFDGHKRAPLPRFTILGEEELTALHLFFNRLGTLLAKVVVPGGNIVVASNPLLSHIVASAMCAAGLERRGSIVRMVMTMRGGDRPKNAHEEFPDVSVMPRSMWEPWIVFRRPLDGRVQDNLRRWKTGGFRRLSEDKPFGDVIKSSPTQKREREIAPHPSLKPQAFLRHLVRGVLPLGEGVLLDPFAGSASTLAAANAVGYQSIGVEADAEYVTVAAKALPKLSSLKIDPAGPELLNTVAIKRRRSRA